MNSPKAIFSLFGAALLLMLASASFFIVQEQQLALLLRLGEITDADYEPGIHFKTPLIQNVQLFDKRIQTLDAQPERFLTIEKKFVVVDSFVKWRISDVAQYYRSTRGSLGTTSRLLGERINAALRDEFGKRTVQEVSCRPAARNARAAAIARNGSSPWATGAPKRTTSTVPLSSTSTWFNQASWGKRSS